MDADELPVAILAVVAFAVMAPAWMHYLGQFEPAQAEGGLMAALVLPATAILFLASWVKPELAGTMVGVVVLASVMLLYPWWWELTTMVTGQLTDSPFAQLVLSVSIAALVLSFLVGLGGRRLVQLAQR